MYNNKIQLSSSGIIPPFLLEYVVKDCDQIDKDYILKTLTHVYRLMNTSLEVDASMPNYQPGVHDHLYRMVYSAESREEYPGSILVLREEMSKSKDEMANEAYDHLGKIYDFYKKIFNRNSIDNGGLNLVATVHYQKNYMNAFWDDNQMVFGDGYQPYFNRFTSCIDITAHELTHGVTESEANLDYAYQSGALNESISDVFGIMVKQYVHNQKSTESDWLIGQGLLGPALNPNNDPNIALRSLKDPGKANIQDNQVGHMDQYTDLPFKNDNGGVHKYSGIPSKAFYLLATELGGYAWEKAGKIWYNTLLDNRLYHKSDFNDFAKLTVDNAEKLFDKQISDIVTRSWNQVGLLI
ncbi:M4 family metallopeptidase [Xenorhabdus szentirmaii]|uniref:Neutral metalloproteinase n=1 Tax=Xenorhabdus szentirmaii DSM 16338 TaxID=1427518 RepID=W1IRS6_9GAMM|nr:MULTISPECIES: M4 family metallopeptidase [Xenorhabdus]MBD2792950.1 M4 family metallopeptidase [Xenorhabdus sp. CUL]MBD2806092.1 M4 family metallopeptidase [Xenorhabdus sp. ZM]MBD2826922.1 M4 family metallopeptidase [Xenorhabdus sp. 5]PHM30723.1 zinc metalloproteinase aureolysin [Xenorhabdus szentirmaii DSM 16338]CDL81144.1 Protease prtS [Xenorhabdus szentirmaii DSM 16338]